MSNSITLGGDRLGSGKKEKVYLHGFERSTHDLSYAFRSSMSAGTLVPFLSELALPGDTFDIDLNCDVKTLPTIGPLFGSYKVQLDVFSVPMRLYNGKLHMNMLNVGMNMSQIGLPQIDIEATQGKRFEGDNEQINPSCVFKYLGISGVGTLRNGELGDRYNRLFNAIPYLAYADIYKNYYSNKQEEIGAVIHNELRNENTVIKLRLFNINGVDITIDEGLNTPQEIGLGGQFDGKVIVEFTNNDEVFPNEITLHLIDENGVNYDKTLEELFENFQWTTGPNELLGYNALVNGLAVRGYTYRMNEDIPRVVTFDLKNIDTMRETILQNVTNIIPVVLNENSIAPYGLTLKRNGAKYSKQSTQEGLFLKTYQSDIFNNWISTEWLDGPSGVNAVTAVDTSSGEFTLDTLVLSRKVYDMLNRIAISGGTYDDWLDAVYTHERTRSVENPVYCGGLSKELAFQEVINSSASSFEGQEQPLGALAGRGVMTGKNKGGNLTIKINEPSYIMGIVSLTPRIDYSQGNKWDTNLQSMDDLFKPQLQQIGFQDLITDQMAWWDTEVDTQGVWTYKSAGKQPAWINYMTNYNKCYGNFADERKEMYMTLNRRYEKGNTGIKDLTTYIDPSKFNNIFADTRLDAQNFWVQIGVGMTARRKMSAKVMPNL